MNESWHEVSAALDDIVHHSEKKKGSEDPKHDMIKQEQFLNVESSDERIATAKRRRGQFNEMLRKYLTEQQDTFHPSDVLLGTMPGFVIAYFPGTRDYRRRVRAYHTLYGASNAVRSQEDGQLYAPIISMEEYTDQLIDAVQMMGGCFLRLDSKNVRVHVVERGLARKMILEFLVAIQNRTNRRLIKPRKWMPCRQTKYRRTSTSTKGVTKTSRLPIDLKAVTRHLVKKDFKKPSKALMNSNSKELPGNQHCHKSS